tara:strand:+ start:1408 stop:1848 length:441 start_codon:yes stop_codon:yes gene_type:complete
MAKKKLRPVVNYHPKDLVVVKTITEAGEVKYEVAMITNVHYATQLTTKSYDMRTEAGSGYIYVPVDGNKKCKQYIDSILTDTWIANGGTNNMWIHKRDGHTRANYSKNVTLRYDGQTNDEKDSVLLVGQFEKYNNFVFPTQGPRSY